MEKTNNTKQYVDEFYKKIAQKNKVSDEERQRAVAYSLGYTDEDIELGGDLGLGCGNPLENSRIKEGEWVLDLGSGKGVDVFKAARMLNGTGKAVGIDRLQEMIDKANEIKQKRDFTNAEFVRSDIDDIGLPDNTFDIVISNCVINLLEDKQKVYNEIFRVLKPGGRVSISDIVQINRLPDKIKNDPNMHAT
ncbi:MAG: methyltransferase domain-containing protein [Ezakiella sp.]|nr:methyltransferase domain-containing protein [Ezakiella sp.]MDD7472206.1 methyltransferase domain-containing protein [Bacillota bacterium]MDY3923199.1 methyltransferase domain-containing protein [Ezakiella sp.]